MAALRLLRVALVGFGCTLSLPATLAQTPPPTATPAEFSADARRAYAQGLKDARELIARKNFDEAIAVLDKLTVERPREPQARFLKGVALTDAGRSDDAIAVFRNVINEYPELPEPHNNLAVLYAAKGEYELARNELETAINVAPDYLVAYENLGDVYARLAARSYERAIARDPRNRTAPPKLKAVTEIFAARAKEPGAAAEVRTGTPDASTGGTEAGTSSAPPGEAVK